MRALHDDLLEPLIILQPRIKGRRKQDDAPKLQSLRSSILARSSFRPDRRGAERSALKGTIDVGESPRLSRRCLVKAHYVPMTGGHDAARLHLAYLERDGVERNGAPGSLYGADRDFDRAGFAEPLDGEARQFRFIVSPEDTDIDLTAFTRDLMAHVERDLNRSLIWAAVNHHNTEHPHVHIVLRGVDREGREVRLPRRYIKEDMRSRAQQVLTRELGLRTDADVAEQRGREIGLERLTSLDRKLAALLSDDRRLAPGALTQLGRTERGAVTARLANLARLGVARSSGGGAWQMQPEWEDRLRALGERNDIIKRLHHIAPGDMSRYRFVEPGQLQVPIEGVVLGKGLHDELTGELFAVIESHTGETHYVRLDRDAAAFIEVGHIVRVVQATEPWLKPTDRVLASVSALHGGIYDPARHLAELQATDRRAAATDLVAGNLKRLQRLERYGLVGTLPGDRWKIPSDLVQQLTNREATHPRHRIRVEYVGADIRVQAKYPGPTWLDRQPQAARERAPWGFGAQLTAALNDRSAFLRSRGLEAGSLRQASELDAAERLLLSQRIKRELGLRPAEATAGFRGHLSVCEPLPSGRSFVRIVDEGRTCFVIVPATAAFNRLQDRLVEVVITEGQATVRPLRRLARGDE